MSIEWVNQAIDDLRAWGRANGLRVDVDEIRLLCDYASDYLGVDHLGDFSEDTFEELLLDIYPRKVIAPPESASETIAAARTLVDFLLSTEEIGGKMAARMRATIDRAEPEMPIALADTTRFGMAKSLFSAMGADTLEDGRPAPEGESGAEPCDCPGCAPLPPVRLAPRDALAEAALRVPLLTDARRLVQWMLAGGRTPTLKGRLRARDAAEAATQLAVPDPVLLWELAVRTGLVVLEGGAAFDAEERDPLQVWAETVEFLVEGGTGGAVTGWEVFDGELYGLCDMLYRLQAPLSTDLVMEYLDEIGLLAEEEDLDLDEAVRRMVRCGLVERRDDALALTPLAVWGLRQLYLRLRLDAPEAADLADADAAALIEGLLSGVPLEAAEADIENWLSRRTAAAAAAELLGAVSGAPATARGIAVTVVDRLGPEAEEAVRGVLGEPELRPHAIHWLSARGLAAPSLTEAEVLWMSVDMLALALPAAEDDPESFSENMAVSGPPAHVIEEMWRVDHPDVVEVLELLGRSLPDQNVAKAARKAAFKARSRAIG
ncbi:hypothetical protein [Planobispora longispora]|uniref:Uncharacterized protein n=1 Tax=Planobispora longispora TaxID=28887 RepID=A0A8J3RH96_9ACTN|nr:hypothetical protein [Planobispora longispora]GIH74211.1 hypothetical protein Plo01_06400 [Planobispora longispora]